MLKKLAHETKHYGQLSALMWKYGWKDVLKQLGWEPPSKEENTAATAEQLAHDIESLGTTYIKLAQIASTREDLISSEYIEALQRLQDDVEPESFEVIEEVIEEGLGAKTSHLFQEFERKPLASASIGQVHRAKLRDGRDVVVKVRRPGACEEANEQLASLKKLASVVDGNTEVGKKFRFRSLVGAVAYALSIELDYRQEATNLSHLHENLKEFDRIRVPLPIPQMVSSEVLVMEYVPGTPLRNVAGTVLNEIGSEKLADQLVNAYLHQILVDGLFHADPHPGNLILHNGNMVGMLDAGMVVRLPPTLRREIAALLLAFSQREGERAASIAQRIGQLDRDFDSQAFRPEAARIVARGGDNDFQTLSLGRTIVEFLNVAGKHGLVLPFELILLSKAFLQLETTLAKLNPKQDPQELIRNYAFRILTERAREQLNVGQMAATALDSAELASSLPRRLNEITRLISENRLKVDVDAVDEAELIGGMRKIANRITSGLIVASMIIGASLIMRLDTPVKFLGYPLLATLFFLVAAVIGGVLVWKATFADRY